MRRKSPAHRSKTANRRTNPRQTSPGPVRLAAGAMRTHRTSGPLGYAIQRRRTTPHPPKRNASNSRRRPNRARPKTSRVGRSGRHLLCIASWPYPGFLERERLRPACAGWPSISAPWATHGPAPRAGLLGPTGQASLGVLDRVFLDRVRGVALGSAGRCLFTLFGPFDQLAFEHDVDLVADDEPSIQHRIEGHPEVLAVDLPLSAVADPVAHPRVVELA